MKRLGAIVLSVLAAVLVFSAINGFGEAASLHLGIFITFISIAAAIYCGNLSYKYLIRKWKIPKLNRSTKPENEMLLVLLYTLLITQLIFSAGYANEFSDHVVEFIFALIFFMLEIFLIWKVNPSKGVTIFLSVLLFFSVINLIIFVSDMEIISNKYPAEEYYRTYNLVVVMSIGRILLELIKLATLHFDRLKKVNFRTN